MRSEASSGEPRRTSSASDGRWLALAFSSSGKAEIKDGYVYFVGTGRTGALAAGERSGSAALMDRGSSWGLEGSGHAAVAGPFNFDFSKAK